MRWNNKTSVRPYSKDLDVIIAEEIIWEAYYEGYINWNVYTEANARIRTVINGTWIFEQPQKDEETDGENN
jgi:hypothetical protein